MKPLGRFWNIPFFEIIADARFSQLDPLHPVVYGRQRVLDIEKGIGLIPAQQILYFLIDALARFLIDGMPTLNQELINPLIGVTNKVKFFRTSLG